MDRHEFQRLYKDYFTAPGDWHEKDIAAGTSSLINWLEWVPRDKVSASLLQILFQKLADGNAKPTLHNVRSAYQRQAGANRPNTDPSQKCGACDDTGVVPVAVSWVNRGVSALIPPGKPVPREEPFPNAVFCRCSIGQVHQARKQRPTTDRLWHARFPDWPSCERHCNACRKLWHAQNPPRTRASIGTIPDRPPRPDLDALADSVAAGMDTEAQGERF